MPSFTTRAVTRAPPERVFGWMVTLANWPSFRGFGPLPGIAEATLLEGTEIREGSVVRVQNTDGTVHHGRVVGCDPPHGYVAEMDLVPPASRLMAGIEERVTVEATPTGSRVTRRFRTRPRAWYTAPLVFLVTWLLLRPAVKRHDRVVTQALDAETAVGVDAAARS